MPETKIENIIFDLGGVLIDWNPRYLYRKVFDDEERMEWFLCNICTPEWNDQQDAGRSFAEATRELVERHPEWKEPIEAWYSRWTETIGGPIRPTVEILSDLKNSGSLRLYALTNWSAETFPWALENFPFLQWFDGIVVSGVERTRKPFPEIYRILLQRFSIEPRQSLFIDDNSKNVMGARELGIQAIHFKDPETLRQDLTSFGVFQSGHNSSIPSSF